MKTPDAALMLGLLAGLGLGALASLFAHRCMSHGRRVRDQAFDPAQGFGQRETLQSIDKSAHRLFPPLEIEGQHRTEPILLPTRNLVSGMAFQPGKMNVGDRRLLVQQIGQDRAILLLDTDPGIESSEPPKSEIRIEG